MPLSQITSPKSLGYRMPAEWEAQEAIWFSWPHPKGMSFPGRYQEILPEMINLMAAIGENQLIRVNVNDSEEEQHVRKLLSAHIPSEHLEMFLIPTEEPWCRDHGPIFVTDSKKKNGALINWGFNAWGEKYHPFQHDNQVAEKIATALHLPLFSPSMILEGGSVDVNGKGALLTTRSCLLNPNRNPHLSQTQIEKLLQEYLGIDQVIWLGEGIEGDDTDGHIDDITRFVSSHSVVTALEPNMDDPNHHPLAQNYHRLTHTKLYDGQPLEVIALPMPPRLEYQGTRLPASYANFLITNQSILLPGYDPHTDEEARGILQELFPQRKVITLKAHALIWGLGAFHCLSQQQPKIEKTSN